MARRSSSRLAPGVFTLVAITACGGSGSVAPSELFDRLYLALCKYEVACNHMPDLATCMAATQREVGYLDTLEQDIASGKVKYDAVQAGACIDFFERLYAVACSRSAVASVGNIDNSICKMVFVGTVAPGGACFFAAECAGGGSCQQTDQTCSRSRQCCAGTCVAPAATIPLGGDCASGQACASGSFCDTTSGVFPPTCVAATGEGTACTPSTLCATPLYCDLDPTTNMGTCRQPGATGAPCSLDNISASCDDGRDYCDSTTVVCTRRVGVAGSCSGGQSCVSYTQCDGTTCVAKPRAGEPCDPAGSLLCLGSLQCAAVTNTCTLTSVGGVCM